MKFIHTADWHLGNSINGIDRSLESKEFFAWLKARIVEEQAVALVVAGDVFDTVNPPTEARQDYFKFLASLLDSPCKNVVIIGGNHDSGMLLDAPRDILEALNIHVIGGLNGRQAADLVVVLKDASGNSIGVCGAVPFVRDVEFKNFTQGESLGALYASVLNEIYRLCGEKQLPFVATGHLYAADIDDRGHSSESDDGVRDLIGNLGNVPSSVFPDAFDYVALGHIHYMSMVAKNPRIRYSGSPFVMGFDEASIPHYVLSVDVETGKLPVVKPIEVPQVIHFKRIEGTSKEISDGLNLLKKQGNTGKTYVEILFKPEPGLDIREKLRSCVEGAPFEVIRYRAKRMGDVPIAMNDDSIESVQSLSENEVFKRLVAAKNPELPEDELEKICQEYLPLFNEVCNKVKEEN
ncbi:MAG: exonuclease SbcCD subunit D C-terminal domain-containing protein [Fibrobacteraceae bacterium]|nr:exonuclease SbcCD subunit D C-terminal domain-containing protein [Fibrobacteraceae bacterium]